MILLGETVKDLITGVEGIVMARTVYLTGCSHIGVQQKAKDDGSVPDWYWTDERRFIVLEVPVFSFDNGIEEDLGGPAPNPAQW